MVEHVESEIVLNINQIVKYPCKISGGIGKMNELNEMRSFKNRWN